jgi:hypothetical protein
MNKDQQEKKKASRTFVLYVTASCVWFIFGYDALTRSNYRVNPPKMQPPVVAYTYFGIGILMLSVVTILYYRRKKQQEKK